MTDSCIVSAVQAVLRFGGTVPSFRTTAGQLYLAVDDLDLWRTWARGAPAFEDVPEKISGPVYIHGHWFVPVTSEESWLKFVEEHTLPKDIGVCLQCGSAEDCDCLSEVPCTASRAASEAVMDAVEGDIFQALGIPKDFLKRTLKEASASSSIGEMDRIFREYRGKTALIFLQALIGKWLRGNHPEALESLLKETLTSALGELNQLSEREQKARV